MLNKKIKGEDRKSRLSPLTVVMLVLLVAYCVMLLGLIFWMTITALKKPLGFNTNRVGLPDPWYFKNFGYVLKNAQIEKEQGVVPFAEIILNSVVYAVGCSVVNTFVTMLVAYLCAHYKNKFSSFVYSLVLVVMVIPVVGNQTSELQTAINLGIYDSMLGMLIMRATFLGLYFLVFHEMFRSVPSALSEAAEIDGAGDFQIMVRIYFPLARNTALTVLLIYFIQYWNNFQTPMLFVPNHPTLAEYLFRIVQLSKGKFSRVPVQMSAALMLLAPVAVIFLCSHKWLLGNLSIGGVKG